MKTAICKNSGYLNQFVDSRRCHRFRTELLNRQEEDAGVHHSDAPGEGPVQPGLMPEHEPAIVRDDCQSVLCGVT